MNKITVPKQYRSEMRDTRTPEYKIAEIRDYVKKHPNEVITYETFVEIAGSTAANYVKKLLQQGRLVRYRKKTGERGHHFIYVWIDEPKPNTSSTNDGIVHTRSLNFDAWPLETEKGYVSLSNNIDTYLMDSIDELDASEMKGILRYKKHIRDAYDKVKSQREEALKNKGGDDE